MEMDESASTNELESTQEEEEQGDEHDKMETSNIQGLKVPLMHQFLSF